MAGHVRYTALLDACVLYPLAMTDAVMSLATAGLYAAKWTTRIEQEWIRSLERQRPELVGRLRYGVTLCVRLCLIGKCQSLRGHR